MKKEIYINLIRINSFILYILPISLVTGPFIPNLIITLACFITLYLIIFSKQWHYFNNFFFKFFFLFSIYLIITSILNKNFNLNSVSGYTYIRYSLFSIVIWHTLDNNNNFFRNFTKFTIITILIVCFDSIFQYFNETNLLGIQKSSYNKISSFFGRDPKLGAYLARLYLFSFIFIYLFLDRKYLRTLYLNLFNVLIVLIILLTGERTSFLIFILNFLLINLIIKENFSSKLSKFITVIIATIVIFVSFQDVKSRYIDTTVKQLTEFNGRGFNLFSKGHENHYKIALKMFVDNKLFGQGPNTFRELCSSERFRISDKNEGCSTHPHNIYIQLLGETGLIGLLFILVSFLYIYINLISYLIKSSKKNINFNNRVFFYIPIAVYLFPFIPTGSFFNSWVNIIVYLPMGFLLKEIHSGND
jgi:O-antigen ligase